MVDVRARHVAYLAGAVLLVAVAVQTSDIATVRWREIDGIAGFEYPTLARWLFVAERWVAGSRQGIAMVNAVVAVAATVAVSVSLQRSGANVTLWLAAPTLLLVAVNVDAVTALLVTLAVLEWRRSRWATAGALVGAGTAFRVAPGVLLAPFLATAPGWAARFRLVAPAAAVWLVVNVPHLLTRPDEWRFPYRFAAQRGDIKGSLWAALPLGRDAVNVASTALVIAIGGAVALAVARRRLSPSAGAALALLGFMAAGKLWQPHYLLWALPLLAMTSVPRRPVRVLELTNLAYFLVLWRQMEPQAEAPWLWLTAGGRLLALAWLVVVLVRVESVPRPAPVAEVGPARDS